MWLSSLIVIVGISCFADANISPHPKCKTDFYAMKFREESSENEIDHIYFSNTGTDSRETSDLDQDELDSDDCSIDDRMKFGGNDGFTDCKSETKCDPNSRYRTMDGSCNNLQYPLWGATNQCFRRFYPAHYEGSDKFRKSVNGSALPKPRQLSLNIFKQHHRLTADVSFMFTIYGQTVAHDISLSKFENPTFGSNCCKLLNKLDSACISLEVSSDDPFYSQFGVKCLDLKRTVTCKACHTDKRQQKTEQTAAMDASIVYGSDDETAKKVRANDGTGKLKSNYTKNGELLPSGNDPKDEFCPMSKKYPCFNAGDMRVNQHSALTSLQTLFMREHNRIAEELKELNPKWDDEKLFQEARRINVAQLQCISYKEYLPNLLGPDFISKFDLGLQRESNGTKYKPSLEFGVWSEFSTAAFRIHSMIATDVGSLKLEMRNLYSNPEHLWKGYLGVMLNGVCKVPSEKYGRSYVSDVNNYLHKKPGNKHGSDLVAIDIQRGRDHGIAPYVFYVNLCSAGHVSIQSFDDLVSFKIISQDDAELLKKNYAKVEDVDLYVGIILENRFKGAIVGPTAACILSRQFYSLKFGDRFYFEHVGETGSFTEAQRESIKQTCSLSRLLCDNSHISKVQINSMLLPSESNPEVRCHDIPQVDLSLWKE